MGFPPQLGVPPPPTPLSSLWRAVEDRAGGQSSPLTLDMGVVGFLSWDVGVVEGRGGHR